MYSNDYLKVVRSCLDYHLGNYQHVYVFSSPNRKGSKNCALPAFRQATRDSLFSVLANLPSLNDPWTGVHPQDKDGWRP